MATTDTNTTRIQFELDNAFLSLIDKEREKANIPTRKQYIEYAFALMGWAVTESQKGKKIASMDETTHQFREITMPPLDFARRQGALLN